MLLIDRVDRFLENYPDAECIPIHPKDEKAAKKLSDHVDCFNRLTYFDLPFRVLGGMRPIYFVPRKK